MTHNTQAAGAATLTEAQFLPALPEVGYLGDDVSYGYDSADMRDYALEAVRAALASTATAPSAPTDAGVVEREARLNRAAGIVAAQAGQSHKEFVEWLCNGGFVQMALSHFGKSVGRERIGFKGPGFDEAAAVVDSNTAPGTPYGDWLAGKTPEHQKLSALMGSVSSDAPAAPSAPTGAKSAAVVELTKEETDHAIGMLRRNNDAEFVDRVAAVLRGAQLKACNFCLSQASAARAELKAAKSAQDSAAPLSVSAEPVTPALINALPQPLRDYIHELEARADPAGTVRELVQLHDTNAGLQNMYRRAAESIAEVIGCFDAAAGEGLAEALAETPDERLKDLVERRLMHAQYAAAAILAQPQPGTGSGQS